MTRRPSTQMSELSRYTSHLDFGMLSRLPAPPSEFLHRSIGRPHSEKIREAPDIRVLWPCTEHGRARKVLSRSGARRRYVVPCFRGGDRDAHCEAIEEALAAVLLDACGGVQFQEQPATIQFEWRGELLEHFPDFLVAYADHVEFWECKRDEEARDLFIRRRTERLQELLAPLRIDYRLVSTRHLVRAAFYTNAIELRRHAKQLLTHQEWLAGIPRDHLVAQTPADQLLNFIPSESRKSALSALIYHDLLAADLSTPVCPSMNVGLPRDFRGERPWVLELFNQSN